MKPKINFITLAVTDLNQSIDFYKNGFGFPSKGIRDGIFFVVMSSNK